MKIYDKLCIHSSCVCCQFEAELQDTVTLSTIESEYMAVVEASKKVLWLRGLINTFNIVQDLFQVHCDSQSVIYLTKDHRYHKRIKHINVRYLKIRHLVAIENVIDLVKISTKKNPTDIMINTIPVEKFRASLNFINVFQR